MSYFGNNGRFDVSSLEIITYGVTENGSHKICWYYAGFDDIIFPVFETTRNRQKFLYAIKSGNSSPTFLPMNTVAPNDEGHGISALAWCTSHSDRLLNLFAISEMSGSLGGAA